MSGVRLRGHHFVCLQFFRGEGYSAAFVANLEGVLERAATAEAQRLDALAIEVLDLTPRERLSLWDARERLKRDAFAVGRWRAEACAGCGWEDVCEDGWEGLLGEE